MLPPPCLREPHTASLPVALFGLRHEGTDADFDGVATDPIPNLKKQVGEFLAKELEGWRRWDIAQWIGTDAARVSDIRHGRLQRFSLETLLRYADRLQFRVELTFQKRRFNEHLKR